MKHDVKEQDGAVVVAFEGAGEDADETEFLYEGVNPGLENPADEFAVGFWFDGNFLAILDGRPWQIGG